MPIGLALVAFLGALTPPSCPTPVDKIVSTMEAQGATFTALVNVTVDGFDQVLIFTDSAGSEIVGLVLRGCVISDPVLLKPERLGDRHG